MKMNSLTNDNDSPFRNQKAFFVFSHCPQYVLISAESGGFCVCDV